MLKFWRRKETITGAEYFTQALHISIDLSPGPRPPLSLSASIHCPWSSKTTMEASSKDQKRDSNTLLNWLTSLKRTMFGCRRDRWLIISLCTFWSICTCRTKRTHRTGYVLCILVAMRRCTARKGQYIKILNLWKEKREDLLPCFLARCIWWLRALLFPCFSSIELRRNSLHLCLSSARNDPSRQSVRMRSVGIELWWSQGLNRGELSFDLLQNLPNALSSSV